MNIIDIIFQWINNNEGVFNILLSICTIVLTMVIAQIPYKKKVVDNMWLREKTELGCYNASASITNVGRSPIFIHSVKVTDNKRQEIESFYINNKIDEVCTMLMPGNSIVVDGMFKNNIFDKYHMNLNGYIKLKIIEISGKTYYISKGFSVG